MKVPVSNKPGTKHHISSGIFISKPGLQAFAPIARFFFYHYLFASQYRHGGPVIAVQVENEYGSFNKDNDYMEYIKEVSKNSCFAPTFLWLPP